MHIVKTYRLPDSNEYEIGFAGRYGLKGEKRGKRKKASPEQIKKQNQKNKENRTRRVIAANFSEGDYFATLKYPAGTRKDMKAVRNDFDKFLRKLRKEYKKHGTELKYMARIEIGAQGGIHIHIIINRIPGCDSDLIIQNKWKCGRVNFQTIYESGGYRKLANYITKVPEEGSEEYEQLMLFDSKERKKLVSISSSKNLVRPEPEVKVYTRRSVRKLVENGPVATEGYYIDKDSIVMGVNPFTGMSYIHYAEHKIKNRKGARRNVYQKFSVQEDGEESMVEAGFIDC